MFNAKEYIKLCCVKKGDLSSAELARLAGMTNQNLCNKYAKNKFTNLDLEKIANALNADLSVKFIDRQTGEPII